VTTLLDPAVIDSSSSPVRNSLWWARTATGLWASPLFAAGVIFCYWSAATKDVALWGDVNWAVGYSPVLLAPLGAAVGAWAGTRARWDRTVDLFDATGRHRCWRAVRTVTTDWMFACLGMLAGSLACAIGPLAARSWGSVDLLLVLTAVAGVWAGMSLGYLLGWLLPHWLTMGAAAIVVYVAQGLLLGTHWQWLFPMTETARIFASWPAHLSLTRVTFFVLMGATAILLSSVGRPRDVLWVTGVAGATLIAGSQLHGWQVQPGDEIRADVCAGDQPRVCVHQAYASLAAQIAHETAAVLSPLAGTAHAPKLVVQSVGQPGFDQSSGVLTFNLMSVDGHVLNSAGLATIGLGMLDSPGSTACADLPPDQAAAGSRARNRIAALMMRQAQDPTERGRAHLVSAFSERWDALRACTASVADLRAHS